MPDLSTLSQPPIPDVVALRQAELQCSTLLRLRDRNLRFYLVVNLVLAVGATIALKMDGPYYADGMVSGLFACGAGLSLLAFRVTRAAERALTVVEKNRSEAGIELPGSVPAATIFLLFAAFFLTASIAAVWFSYGSREPTAQEGDGIARSSISHPEAC